MQYNPFLSSSNSIKRVLYRAETIYIIPYHQNSGLCSNAGQQKWTEAIPRSQKETNKPKLSLEEKQQLILSRSLKEFAIRQKRRQEGIFHDEEVYEGRKVFYNYRSEFHHQNPSINETFTKMWITIPVACVIAVALFLISQAHIIWNRKRIMKENSMDRARRATFIASGQVAKMKAERAAKKEAVERVQNVAKSSL